jgi:uncharacterized repeat protein (TIGR02543 family)
MHALPLSRSSRLARAALAALLFAAVPAAASTFSVTASGSTFTITRSGDVGAAETIRFRTVGISAFAGKHFVATNGVLAFAAGETSKQVTVAETTTNTSAYRFQVGATRRYLFEITDEGGFGILSADRDLETGTSVPATGAFDETEVAFDSGTLAVVNGAITVTDDGFDQGYIAADVDGYYAATAPKSFFSLLLAQLRMTLEFRAKEVNDGYQHVQIVANTSDYDDGAQDDDPGSPDNSRYLACFSHEDSENAILVPYSFPVTTVEDDRGATRPWNGLGNSFGDLRKQRFKSDCRAADGRLVLPTSLTSLHVRFDAAGGGEDDWIASNVVAKIQAVDSRAPNLVTVSSGFFNTVPDISVSPGMHANGNVVRLGVPFQEIVVVDAGAPPALSTSWGSLAYEGGSGCNVLTFSGAISAPVGTALEVTGLSGAVRDLAGNAFAGSVARTFDGVVVDAAHAYAISSDTAGGTLPSGAPTSYTYDGGAVALPVPSRTGYDFAGWTGSNGDEPQVSATIPAGSHGDVAYAAHWTPHAYSVRFDANGGEGSMPDQPFVYGVAQNLATNAFSRPLHDFLGWSASAGGDVDYADGESVTDLASADGAVVTLHAVWRRWGNWEELQWRLYQGGTVVLGVDCSPGKNDFPLAVANAVTLDLNGHTIDGAGFEAVIRIDDGGDLTLTNGAAAGAVTGGSDHGVYVGSNGVLRLRGGAIAGNRSNYGGGGVFVDSDGAFEMSGGEISGNAAPGGGGVFVAQRGSFSMTGGAIAGNEASDIGGGVFLEQGVEESAGGFFEMSGGDIRDNVAGIGGGVFVQEGGDDWIDDEYGEFVPVSLNPGVFRMSGGTIAGNAVRGSYGAAGCGGGVFVAYDDSFFVSGRPVVAGNVNEYGVADDVYLFGVFATVEGALAEGARIGVTTELEPEPGFSIPVAYGATADDRWRFFADDPVYEVRATAEGLVLALPCWADLQAFLDAGGTVTLGADYVAAEGDATLLVTNAVTLDLNGHTVAFNGSKEVFHVGTGGDLTLTSRVEGAGLVTGGGDHGVYVGSNAVFRLQGGAIAGNVSDFAGGGVFVNRCGTFEMSGGAITNNAVSGQFAYGGGVYAVEGTFAMTGGEISGNAAKYGGGLFADGGAPSMTGGAITNNAASYGGGAYLKTGTTLAVSGGAAIAGNASTNSAGAANNVHLADGATLAAGGLAAGAAFGVTTAIAPSAFLGNSIAVATGVSAGEAAFFSSDRPGYVLEAGEDGVLRLRQPLTWAVLQDRLDRGGRIRLPDDCAAAADDAALLVTNAVVLDLNGRTLEGNGLDAVLCVGEGGVLALTNGVDATGTVTNGRSGVVLEDGGVFTMDGGAIRGNATSWGGGGVLVGIGCTFTMNGGEISGNAASFGGGVLAYGGAFTMNGGVIRDNAASGAGGGVAAEEGYSFDSGTDFPGSITMNGGEISGNRADEGGGVYVGFICRFEMIGGEISGNEADSGGGVDVEVAGVFEMSGGAILGNAAECGGGVRLNKATLGEPPAASARARGAMDGGAFTTTGGEISRNATVNYGGGSFAMTGGAISGNAAVNDGGGVYMEAGAFAMEGGTISGNGAWLGGGVRVNGGTVAFSGAPVVSGNTNDVGRADNVYLWEGRTFGIDSLAEGASIGVTTDPWPEVSGPVAFATGATADDRRFFFSDVAGFGIEEKDGTLLLTRPAVTPWMELQARLDAGGIVKLEADCAAWDFDDPLEVTNAVALDLNGRTVAYNGSDTAVCIFDGGHLTLTNSVPGSGAITGGGSLVNGGGVYVGENGAFTMDGGTISSNAADYGGGVYVDWDAAFTMNAGTISGNTAAYGGGVYAAGTFTMTGGTIAGNAAIVVPDGDYSYGGIGGGVYMYEYGTFAMTGGEISGNRADDGGGVYGDANGTFSMDGGEISGNSALSGGGVYVNQSAFKMKGGAITGNVAVVRYDEYGFEYGGAGGGVFVCGPEMSVSGRPVVSGNADSRGATNNVFLCDWETIAVDGLAEGASIGVTAEYAPTREDPVFIAVGATEGDAAYFFSDSLSYGVEFVNGELCLTFGGVYPEYVYYADDVVKANWLAWAARTGAGTNVAYEAAFLLDVAPAELDAPTDALLRVSAIVPTAAGCRLELESGIRGLFQPDGKEGTCYLCNGVLALEFAENLEEQETGWALRLVDAAIEDGRAVVEFVFYDGEPAPDALFLRPSIRSSVPKN